MHKIIKRLILIGVAVTMLSGCSLLEKKPAEPEKQEVQEKATSSTISKSEDDKIKKVISAYFVKLYQGDIDAYGKDNIMTGSLPANLTEFIAKSTIELGNNNVENGINLPRYLEVNGLTAISYEMINNGKEPAITLNFTNKRDNINIYLTKVQLKAKAVANSIFDNAYKQTNEGYYEKKENVTDDKIENMKLELQYEVGVIKEGEAYKIVYAKEAIEKQVHKFRVNKQNNEHVKRLPWLNIAKAENGKDYLVKTDGERYEKEKNVITLLLENFKKFNSDNINMVDTAWDKGEEDFRNIMAKLGILKDAKSNAELLVITKDYKTNIGFDSLPLQKSMHKLSSIDKVSIQPHPAYSDLNVKYIVSFESKVDMKNGIPPEGKTYKFDYNIKLLSKDKLVVDSIKLNEYSIVQKN